MNHMPGHIYVLCGQYEKAKQASEKAIRADRLYRDYAGDNNFYTTARCHDLHLMVYTCMFLGQYQPALAAVEEMCSALTPELIGIRGRPQMTTTPWAWMHPPRHALAALLLEQGHCEEAERVYRADLGLNDDVYRCVQHPGNMGLPRCVLTLDFFILNT